MRAGYLSCPLMFSTSPARTTRWPRCFPFSRSPISFAAKRFTCQRSPLRMSWITSYQSTRSSSGRMASRGEATMADRAAAASSTSRRKSLRETSLSMVFPLVVRGSLLDPVKDVLHPVGARLLSLGRHGACFKAGGEKARRGAVRDHHHTHAASRDNVFVTIEPEPPHGPDRAMAAQAVLVKDWLNIRGVAGIFFQTDVP